MHRLCSLALVFTIVCAGCASTPESAPPPAAKNIALVEKEIFTFLLDKQPLGLALRELARETGANLVLMNGLENYPLDTIEFESNTVPEILERISEETGCKIQDNESYYFLYAPDYESLTGLDLQSQLPEPWSTLETSASFGADTPLFNVFALLGESLETAVAGDNAIADSESGELHLENLPLTDVLEAILKSSRVRGFNVRFQATDDYLFLYTPGNRLRNRFLAESHAETNVDLERTSTVRLLFNENDTGAMEGQLGSSRLKQVLPQISAQLGLPVEAEPSMAKLPVNPVVLHGVTRKDALELLIRQWLLPEFGYDVTKEGIRLRYLGPES